MKLISQIERNVHIFLKKFSKKGKLFKFLRKFSNLNKTFEENETNFTN